MATPQSPPPLLIFNKKAMFYPKCDGTVNVYVAKGKKQKHWDFSFGLIKIREFQFDSNDFFMFLAGLGFHSHICTL